jgi:hypothetical protein
LYDCIYGDSKQPYSVSAGKIAVILSLFLSLSFGRYCGGKDPFHMGYLLSFSVSWYPLADILKCAAIQVDSFRVLGEDKHQSLNQPVKSRLIR